MDLCLGSRNDQVRALEQRLNTLDLYSGPMDGMFGGSVESGVKQYQKEHGLVPDGNVARNMERSVSRHVATRSALERCPLAERCLALSGAFETTSGFPECFAGLTGDFDGEDISFGVLQWNIGQGTLQPMFSQMLQNHPEVMTDISRRIYRLFRTCCRLQDNSSLLGGLRSKAPTKPTSSSHGGATC